MECVTSQVIGYEINEDQGKREFFHQNNFN